MRRWMTIITLATLVIAVVAGWGIGQLAGGGSGDTETVVRVIPTVEPTATVEPTTAPTTPAQATPTSEDEATPSTPDTLPAAPPEETGAPEVQQPTRIPDTP